MSNGATFAVVALVAAGVFGLVWFNHAVGNSAMRRGKANGGGSGDAAFTGSDDHGDGCGGDGGGGD